jgi:serine/threonine-protein kinase
MRLRPFAAASRASDGEWTLNPDVMTIVPPANRQHLEPLLEAALTLPASERIAFVEREASDPDVRAEVTRLLSGHESGTLAQRLRAGALSVREALGHGMQIAEALGAAHARGMVHCDLRPANVVLTADGIAKLVDFGAARTAGDVPLPMGSADVLAYMSPEHLRGHVDARSDVWSLGVMLYEMLTGFRPFEAEERDAVLRAIRAGDVPSIAERRPDVPDTLLDLVHRCLAPDPAVRPENGRALLAALEPIERAMSTAAPKRRSPLARLMELVGARLTRD